VEVDLDPAAGQRCTDVRPRSGAPLRQLLLVRGVDVGLGCAAGRRPIRGTGGVARLAGVTIVPRAE
jgi:hypothetical protein